ncbi:ABC transporter permease [Halocalculus aciditolerans]|uniref:Uncharacterized protein n=1 Tax=Halocalculus aciditolerans TaxID=1383812 RepID=A0A830FBK8_9EURY|nr:hypothetical protein [Halocalculus aciditolerans]GGL73427.1 hypothetical protein GCM10009039_34420 [Halocalculus aciditolerans]
MSSPWGWGTSTDGVDESSSSETSDDSDSMRSAGWVEGIVIGVLIGVIEGFGNSVADGITWFFDEVESGVTWFFGSFGLVFQPLGQDLIGLVDAFTAAISDIIVSTGAFAPITAVLLYGAVLFVVAWTLMFVLQVLDPR